MFALLASPAGAAPTLPGGDYDVVDYRAELAPAIAEKVLVGTVKVLVESRVEGLEEVVLEAPGLEVTSVTAGGAALVTARDGALLRVRLAAPLARGDRARLAIGYRGAPARGMRFGERQVLTSFHTTHWLPGKSDPADRASLTLALTLPGDLDVIASGDPLEREELGDGRVRHVWRQERPVPGYLFGFAAAPFQRRDEEHDGVKVELRGVALGPPELERIYARFGEMLRFFAARAGVAHPGARYAQALLP